MDYGPHQRWEQRRILLQHILRYLNINGPTLWPVLYLHFDKEGTGEIGKALYHLADCKYICIDGATATITQLGIDQLNRS